MNCDKKILNQFKAVIEKAYTDLKKVLLKLELYQNQTEITKAAIRILKNDYSAKCNRFDDFKILNAIWQKIKLNNL